MRIGAGNLGLQAHRRLLSAAADERALLPRGGAHERGHAADGVHGSEFVLRTKMAQSAARTHLSGHVQKWSLAGSSPLAGNPLYQFVSP